MSFIRIKVSLILSLVTVSGYLMFNTPGTTLLYAVLASFFIYTGCYAYNNMTDTKEDLINNRKVSPLASSKLGYAIVLISGSLGMSFSLFLSIHAVFLSLMTVSLGVLYSSLKIKKYLVLKNVFTAVIVAASFLIGASISQLTAPIVMTYLLFFMFFFIGSVVSDLRDCEGDRAAGFRTIPVHIGYGRTKTVLFIALPVYSLFLYFAGLLVLLPFVAFISVGLYKDRPAIAHSCGGISFIFLAAWYAMQSLNSLAF
ncbi:MAG: UbiA family prenyltransferase [Candidatus Aenigmarchaeota archaeon]|nr:UbiA family prenyltransferase [Candidatus Aenigmarchaeota archaeon]